MSNRPYPAPLTIPPLREEEHTHTWIVLHGRGSNAERFGREFLSSANLQHRLPTVKFVFPTARKRRSTILKKITIHQWFDNDSLEGPGQRTDLQVEGLCETAAFLRALIKHEASLLGQDGHRRVILGGLSQGCAVAIFTILGGNESDECKVPGAFFGMSGWLPFEQQLGEILQYSQTQDDTPPETITSEEDDSSSDVVDTDSDDGDNGKDAFSDIDHGNDLFSRTSPEHDDFDPFLASDNEVPRPIQALNHIRDILDLAPLDELQYHGQTPIFLGHGSADPKVSVALGQKMARLLSEGLEMDVTWKVYEDFGHWYKVPDEIDDILSFLQVKVDLPVATVGG